jgi:hypothetical protein
MHGKVEKKTLSPKQLKNGLIFDKNRRKKIENN